MQTGTVKQPAGTLDCELVFQQMPGLCLILDPGFNIVAQSEARPAKPLKSIQWIDLSAERSIATAYGRLERAASMRARGDCR